VVLVYVSSRLPCCSSTDLTFSVSSTWDYPTVPPLVVAHTPGDLLGVGSVHTCREQTQVQKVSLQVKLDGT